MHNPNQNLTFVKTNLNMSADLWFEECVKHPSKVRTPSSGTYIYKGYKVSKQSDEYTILNVRLNDFYTAVNDKDLQIFTKHGFIGGADLLYYRRNKKRVSNYTKVLERLYHSRNEYKLKTDNEYFVRKLVNCEDRILYYLDLLLLCKSRVVSYEEVNGINQE